jgi:hypothetical protein
MSLVESEVSHLNVEEAALAESSSRDDNLRKEMATLRIEVQQKINKVSGTRAAGRKPFHGALHCQKRNAVERGGINRGCLWS